MKNLLLIMLVVVCSVHDGDTFTLCNGQRIRLWGINAPELGEPLSYQSRDRLKAMVLNRDVSLDCSHGKSYKRKVCQVFSAGADVAKILVDEGLAVDWPKYSHGQYAKTGSGQ